MSPVKRYWFPLGSLPPCVQEHSGHSHPSMRLYNRGKWSPDTDVYEVAGGLIIIMDIAGITRNELKIIIEDRILSVSGIRREPPIPDKQSVKRLEIDFGAFEKRFRIPGDIDDEQIEARYENGFLYLKLPRTKQKKITIDHR